MAKSSKKGTNKQTKKSSTSSKNSRPTKKAPTVRGNVPSQGTPATQYIVNDTTNPYVVNFLEKTNISIANETFSRRYDEVTDRYADFHAHGKDNSDGQMTFLEALQLCQMNNVDFLGFTIHNSTDEIREIISEYNLNPRDAHHDVNLKRVSFIVEATVRIDEVKNFKGNATKAHLLVIGANMTENSPFVQLMKIKAENDRLVDYGVVRYISKMLNVNFDEKIKDYVIRRRQVVPGFNSFGKEDTIRFFAEQGIDLAKSQRELDKLFNKIPRVPRLNLSMKDVIKVAHVSGAMVVFAHPETTLCRTPDPKNVLVEFFRAGGDGIEMIYNGMTEETFKNIKAVLKSMPDLKNKIILTAGSDAHKHGDDVTIGRTVRGWIPISAVAEALEELDKLQTAREQGKLTHREYDPVTKKEIDTIIKTARRLQQSYVKQYNKEISKLESNTRETEGKISKMHKSKGMSKDVDIFTLDFESYIDVALISDEEKEKNVEPQDLIGPRKADEAHLINTAIKVDVSTDIKLGEPPSEEMGDSSGSGGMGEE